MSSSGGEDAEEADEVCANCGKAAVDNIKLKLCTACKLVKYCSVECQKNHRPQHKKACKKKAAEIRYNLLFTQPDGTYLGECPICCLPHSLDITKSTINTCCSKIICKGCDWANKKREDEAGQDHHKCPFCREPLPKTMKEITMNETKRIKANDPVALKRKGNKCNQEQDYDGAFEYWKKAAQLGDIEAHYNLSSLYGAGKVVEKDEKKEEHHLEEAAIGGHPVARLKLIANEYKYGRFDETIMKHLMIAAKLGDDEALKTVKQSFFMRGISKEDYEAALRGHQAAVDATKSEQRNAAEEYYKQHRLAPDEWYKRRDAAEKLFSQRNQS